MAALSHWWLMCCRSRWRRSVQSHTVPIDDKYSSLYRGQRACLVRAVDTGRYWAHRRFRADAHILFHKFWQSRTEGVFWIKLFITGYDWTVTLGSLLKTKPAMHIIHLLIFWQLCLSKDESWLLLSSHTHSCQTHSLFPISNLEDNFLKTLGEFSTKLGKSKYLRDYLKRICSYTSSQLH